MIVNNIISCGVFDWFGSFIIGDLDVWINEFIVIVVNILFCVFFFLSNLVIIIMIIKIFLL